MHIPAKINLYLHVTGKRPDGYHLLDSLIVFTDICDEVIIENAGEFSLKISGEFAHLVENNEQNIVARAVKLMASECGAAGSVAIKLVKNIPVGAGLGGGSGDAAATLMLLNDLWQAGLSTKKLCEIGLKIGADVPVFIGRKAAFVSGIGEELRVAKNMPELYAILVYPNKPLSTKDVFTLPSPRRQNAEASGIWIPACAGMTDEEEILSFLKTQRNDLTNAAISLMPEIKGLLEELSALEGCELVRMSGSGSTCFAIFTDKKQAEENLNQLSQKHPDYWIKLCALSKSF